MPSIRSGFALCLGLGLSLSGCSQFSEWYACGVPCQYGPRPPLPYQQYPAHVCHSHVVSLPRLTQIADSEDTPSAEGDEAAQENETD